MQAVHENRIVLVEAGVIVVDALELGYSIKDELQAVLIDLLTSTTPDHYTGHKPPERSYETKIKDLELFAFSVECSRFDQRIYYKFSLKGERIFLVSLHVCRRDEMGEE